MTKLTINQVLESRIAYAREQSEALAKRAASLGERASRCVARGDFRDAATAAKEAEMASAEAHMWEECSQALLTPIAIYLGSKS